MARFVHIADARDAARIRRSGLRSTRDLFCVPMTADPLSAFQWARELRARGYRTSIAIIFVVPDERLVSVGRFGQPGTEMTAAQAVDFFRRQDDSRGLEVRISGSVGAGDVKSIRRVPRNAGWRFYPEAKGKRPFWPFRGSINARRLRHTIETGNR